jgi:predicted regulator of Ras-like GTPase activity (Roadblock/LC7/MglB family)
VAFFGGPSTPVSRLEELKRILQKDPTSRQFLPLAEEYRRHGKLRDAVITLERGLQMHATSVAAHVALGRSYQQLDRLEDAVRAFTNALQLDRENLVAIRQLGEVYLARGEKVEAIKKLKLYRGLNAGDRDVNEIIQRLEEELAAAAVERRRVDGQGLSEGPGAPRPSPDFTSGIRRAAMMQRLDRAQPPPPPAPPVPHGTKPDPMPLTDDAALSEAAGAAAPEQPLSRPSAGESLLIVTHPVVAPVPEEPESPFALPHSTAPIAPVRVEPAPEEAPFALAEDEAEADVPEEEATKPFTFPVDLYGAETATRAFVSPVEKAPFEVDEPRPSPAAAGPLVSQTLANLYLAQGHMADARETYRTLAETAADEARARAPRERAAPRPAVERKDHSRLRRFARRFPKRPEATADNLHGLLRDLVDGTEGIRAATLTDVDGLPVVTAGLQSGDAAMETLVAELSSFLKNARRTASETGAGELESLAIAGPNGGAVVSRVNADYSLILQVDPEAALGEIRWEAARTARALRPAVR